MEGRRQLLGVVGEAERGAVAGAALDEPAELGELAGERGLGRVGQQAEVVLGADGATGHLIHAELGRLLLGDAGGLAQDGAGASVRVLHVVDRVGVVLLLGELDVEVDHLVVGLCHQRVAGCVGTDLLQELVEGHHGALALGHAHRLAVAQQVDQLAEKHLELRGIPQGRAGGLDALDVAVVVCAPDVDDVVHALELVPVVGDVGGKVGVLAVGLDEDAVLVVAEVGGAEPQSAGLVLVEVAELVELG